MAVHAKGPDTVPYDIHTGELNVGKWFLYESAPPETDVAAELKIQNGDTWQFSFESPKNYSSCPYEDYEP